MHKGGRPGARRSERETDVMATSAQRRRLTPLVAGTLVGHFKVLRWLGQGSTGEVYLARDTNLGRKVAIKLIHPQLVGSPRAVDRFLLEARATARFSHPNIVTIHHVGDHEGRPYVALEYLQGQDVRTRMEERCLSLPETLRIATAIADALTEAHRHGILHRDLKPENVVIAADGTARVVDFGLAKRIDQPVLPAAEEHTDAPPSTRGLVFDTRSGLMGTPAYMAPEQWLDLECSPATDVWAIGVMLFEFVTGRLPFDEGSAVGLAQAVCGRAPAPRLDDVSDAPAELSELVAACLEKDPPDRPTAAEVAQRLRQLLVPAAPSLSEGQSPFRGLLPFAEQHAHLFFGREAEIAAFVERLRCRPVLPVVGPSGAGKSSFVQAGVIARLRE